jgi:hypothetical protein
MAGHWTDTFTFIGGAVRSRTLTYLAMVGDESAENRIPGTSFVLWNGGKWQDCGDPEWNLAGIAVAKQPLEQMIAVGEWGEVLCVGSGDEHDEHVMLGQRASDPKGPKDRGQLRGVRRIGSRIYVVGMDRQAYRREGTKRWQPFGPPGWREQGLPPPTAADVKGFEAIDGFSETDLYAVGWDGEIWNHDGRNWRQLPSPTNMVLTDVCCAGDGMVYTCGREGLLLKGRNQSWQILDLGEMNQDIWSLAWFNDQLYLSTMYRLFKLEGDKLAAVDTGNEDPKTCYRLSVGDGVLWSIGAKDVLTFDGKTWTRND